MKNSLLRYMLVLTVIAMASGVSLGFFQGLTYQRIEDNRRAEEAAAVSGVLGTDQFTAEEVDGTKLYRAGVEGELVAFSCSPGGFGGPISLMVGLNLNEQAVKKIVVLNHTETPGLGARIGEDWFTDQFGQKTISDPFQVKKDVEAITGATISSRAVTQGVKTEAQRVMALVKAGVSGE